MTIVARGQFLLGEWSNTLANSNVWFGAGIFFFTVATLSILWKKLDSHVQLFAALIGICTTVAWILLTLFQHDVWSHYVVAFPVLWVMVVSLALLAWYQHISRIMGILLLIIFSLIAFPPGQLIHQLQNPYFSGNISVYRNQLAVVDTVYQQAQGKPFKYAVYTAPIVDYTYQYLFSWYGPKKYGYQPSGPATKLYFVIIEPDDAHPSLRTAWILSRAHDGTVVSEKTLSTGVIVQKRIVN